MFIRLQMTIVKRSGDAFVNAMHEKRERWRVKKPVAHKLHEEESTPTGSS
jgi:hypothetical protein